MRFKRDGHNEDRKNYPVGPYERQEYAISPDLRYFDFQEEEEVHLRDYLNVIRRRKWIVIIFLLSVFVTVTLFTFMAIPQYKATTVIKIDKEAPRILSFADVEIDRPDADYYETQYKILKSRAIAKRVIWKYNLDKDPNYLPVKSEIDKAVSRVKRFFTGALDSIYNLVNRTQRRSTRQDNNTAAKDSYEINDINNKFNELNIKSYYVNSLLSRLEVVPIKKSRLVEVSFISHDPRLSQKVANAVAEAYIDFNLESKLNASVEAQKFLQKQIDNMKAKVEESEEALNAYASKNQIIFLDKENSRNSVLIQKLSQLSSALNKATADRIQKEALYREIKESGTENPIILNNALILGLKKQLSNLEADYYNLLNIFKPDYPKMKRLMSQMDAIRAKIKEEKAKLIKSIESDYRAALKRENYLKESFEAYKKKLLEFQNKTVQYQILKREVDANKELYNSLLQRLKEIRVSATKTATNIQILDRAELPKRPFKPNKVRNLLLAIVMGLMGGIGLAFFVEYFDNTIKDVDEIERKANLPMLGIIPYNKKYGSPASRDVKDDVPMIPFKDNPNPVAEAFRSISTFILLSSADKPPKSILITSAGEQEGKTTVSTNTAMALRETLGDGILIDADMRRPKLHRTFGVDNRVGLSTFLSGNTHLGNGLIKNTDIKGLHVIPSGPIPPNPSELLVSKRMRELIESLSEQYNFIIIDSPPIMGMPDSVYLSSIVDGTVLVVKSGHTQKNVLKETKKILRNINAKVLGVVLNGIRKDDIKYGYYSNYYSSYFKEE
ncbi:MAG TPA: polysaccharide biosynthesis tyrosine autokinase [Nitrospirae bacterium]|nr:polysaccharide biosynthesis tyrosine autokinase [Nitrospirota bacterium]